MEHVIWNGFRADPRNLPEKRSGAYRFTCLTNGKNYFGISKNVANRCMMHARSAIPKIGQQNRNLPRFAKALRKYGVGSFFVEPIVYSCASITAWRDDGLWLRELETELILDADSIANGYNLIKHWPGFGPATPATREKMSAKAKARIRTEEFEAVRLAAQRTPEARARRSASHMGLPSPKKGRKFPSAKAKQAQSKLGWITDGTTETRVDKTAAIPSGWRRGRLSSSMANYAAASVEARRGKPAPNKGISMSNAAKQKMSSSAIARWANPKEAAKMTCNRRGRVWITNGLQSTTILPSTSIPDGWHRGRVLSPRD